MTRSIRAALAACALAAAGAALAFSPEEEAAIAVSQQWVKAVTSRDVDAQMELLPPTMFPKPADREKARLMRLHEKEMAQIRAKKITMFGLGPPSQFMKIGNGAAVVIPYKQTVESTEGKLSIDSSLILVTLDGSKWSVIEGAGQNTRSLKALIPGYNGGLAVPVTKSVAVVPQPQ